MKLPSSEIDHFGLGTAAGSETRFGVIGVVWRLSSKTAMPCPLT